MKTQLPLSAVLLGATLFVALPSAANAQDAIVVETITATTYVNGGIGETEQATMRRIAKEFPLRIIFSAQRDGEFVADVPVVITDAHGNPVFELSKAGPMLYVILPNGKYKVSSRFKGLTESQETTLTGKDGEDLYFHWKGKPKM